MTGLTTQTAYIDEIHAWQQDMERQLRAEDGWLTVVGFEWLKAGQNTIGSSPENDTHLPPSAPAHLGVLTVDADRVTLRVTAFDPVTIDGVPADPAQLYLLFDGHTDSTAPIVRMGSVSFFIIQREGQYVARVRDNESETRRNFAGRVWFPPDPAYRTTAVFTPHAAKRTIQVENSRGRLTDMDNPGYVEFELLGEKRRLEAFEADDGRLWFVIRDQTSGRQTYGAGRFVYSAWLDKAANQLELDFNKAYHPPCAFTEFAMCPYPPPENRLPISLPVGEKFPG